MPAPPPPTTRLFHPLPLTPSTTLTTRIAMAPLTRYRADDSHVPTPMMATHYGQRARAHPGTLLIAEGTFISPSAGGYANVPGIWSDAQVAAWKPIVDEVHAAGSFIYLQLWALGRAARPNVAEKEGIVVKGPSAVPIPEDEKVLLKREDGRAVVPTYAVPEVLTKEEIGEKVREYATAARNAVFGAGFDGVEIHSANGYLPDQFIQDVTNTRGDEYGGSVENRARFPLEVVEAVVEAVGGERVGIRFSPWSVFQGMRMKDPKPQFEYLVKEVGRLGVGYLHLVRDRIAGGSDAVAEGPGYTQESLDFAVDVWDKKRPVLIAGGLTPEEARKVVDEQYPDREVVVVFGRHFISNPDLVFRVKEGIEFTPYDRSTFYLPMSEVGYVDQKFSPEFERMHGAGGKGQLLN